MKSISFSKGIEKDININISQGYYKEFSKRYASKYGTLMIIDSNLKNHLNPGTDKNIFYVKGGNETKYFDKYLELCKIVVEGSYSNLVVIGGGSLIDMVGYVFHTLDFPTGTLTVMPTTLSSMIYLPVSGEFYLDMNYTRNFLKVRGYPDLVYIDPYFCKFLDKKDMKNHFFLGYILGLLFDNNFASLSLKYSKNFIRLDLEDYLYSAVKFVLSLYSNDLPFPGTKLMKYIADTSVKSDFVQSESLSFAFLLYLSFKFGYIHEESFQEIFEKIRSFEDLKSSKIQNIKAKVNNVPIREILLKEDGFVDLLLNFGELKDLLLEFKSLLRGV
ncbi:3-dehydroquinate synthase [Petrotoga sp. HKA.pet.4.5]|uniref:3-dehydroquinate synthase n=1 Tax=Petrotoga sp. HKA.pet.4.5 TaxID=1473155 RepID=UPI0011C47340|nr:3-dehydroquinate synthase [Petrotoga sp. HKA.pet.4.5]